MNAVVAEVTGVGPAAYAMRVVHIDGPDAGPEEFELPLRRRAGLDVGQLVLLGGGDGWSVGWFEVGPLLVTPDGELVECSRAQVAVSDAVALITADDCRAEQDRRFDHSCGGCGCQSGASEEALTALPLIIAGLLLAFRFPRSSRAIRSGK